MSVLTFRFDGTATVEAVVSFPTEELIERWLQENVDDHSDYEKFAEWCDEYIGYEADQECEITTVIELEMDHDDFPLDEDEFRALIGFDGNGNPLRFHTLGQIDIFGNEITTLKPLHPPLGDNR